MEQRADQQPSSRSGNRAVVVVRWLTVLSISVAAGIFALGAVVLWDGRRDALHQAEQASTNLVQALGQDIARNVSVFDLSLQGATDAWKQPDINAVSPTIRQMALFDRAVSAEYLGSLLVLNPDGDVIADSTSTVPHALNFADRDYFRVHLERPDAGLFVSRPYRSRLREGSPSIAISRRLSTTDGRFAGVVMGALKLAYFQNLFEKLNLGSDGVVILFRTDGQLIARYPVPQITIDHDPAAPGIFGSISTATSGQFVGTSAIDGITRFYDFHRLGDLPLVLTVGVSVRQVYAAWWDKALIIGAILLLLCAAIVLLCMRFRREMLHRLAAEAGWTAAAETLSRMAATDSLTGLPNRRQFDEVLEREWRRAAREETPLSLVMLDIDRFKAFNDLYGHLAGDDCLRVVAAVIASVTQRSSDLIARYGGEEFALILPVTEAAGAEKVAQAMRTAIVVQGLTHAGNASCAGVVTASFGVATAFPQRLGPNAAWLSLIAEADNLLYEAKRTGRNRVIASNSNLRSITVPFPPNEAARLAVVEHDHAERHVQSV